jgi:hypothetical protein
MTDGQGVKRVWNEDGTIQLEHELISEIAARGRVFDDRGKAREVFLWKGKPVSKKKFMERMAQEQGGADDRPIVGGVAIMSEAEREAIQEEIEEIDADFVRMLHAIERIDPAQAAADPEATAGVLEATAHIVAIDPRLTPKVVQAFRTAGFSEEFIAQHFGGSLQDRRRKKSKRP